MEHLVRFDSHSQLSEFVQDHGWPTLVESDLVRTQVDAHFQLVDGNGTAKARCSLWWKATPRYPNERVGLIGHYAAGNERSARTLLDTVLEELKRRGCTLAIGPMDGNTWEKYRFVTEIGDEPPFLLEPQNPPQWPQHFIAQGFHAFTRYHSSICEDLTDPDGFVAKFEQRLQRRGSIRIRRFDLNNAEADLQAIHAISLECFQRNFLHSPIPAQAFLQQSRKLLPFVDPRFFLLAEDEGCLAAYVFCVPNLLQKNNGHAPDTLVLKTLAASARSRHVGLGSLLLARVHAAAAEHRYRRVIHALIHDENNSTRTSQRNKSRPFRAYTLYARRFA